MKIIFVIILIVYSFVAWGQKGTPELPFVEGKITYTAVVDVDSAKTKSELYSNVREWFAKTYNSSAKVIQMDDKESGKIIGKALFQVYHKAMKRDYPSGYINYTISVFVKDGKYKYEITNFYHTGDGGNISDFGDCEKMINTKMKTMGVSYQKTFDYYLWQMDDYVKNVITDLKSSIATTTKVREDNW